MSDQVRISGVVAQRDNGWWGADVTVSYPTGQADVIPWEFDAPTKDDAEAAMRLLIRSVLPELGQLPGVKSMTYEERDD